MTLRLNGTSSGFTEIDAPAAAGSNKITLPTSNGSAEQFLKNSGTAGTLEFSSMVETSTGVGIGTTSPSHKCQIGGTLAVDSFNDTTKTITLRPGFEANANGGMGLVAKDHSGAAADGLGVYGTDGISLHTANAGTFYERIRLTSDGDFLVGKTSASAANVGAELRDGSSEYAGLFVANSHAPILINRKTTDGVLVVIRQNDTEEGTISVSGSTVSYNGAHLSRWSQLAGGAERIEILRGSVLSNLDEMCEWGEEDNEQLNRMKVSDVEGDVNVAGVFQAWDDEDDTYTNDFYCAMTGDFVIRIAQGTTVARGDLLMSAGDGTAKPQDDDIVRSKTIAKVTSTTVSTTYSDGSYCVPCVLMAC